MAEEDARVVFSADDMSALRAVLHAVQGLSPISSTELVPVASEDE